MADTAVVDSDNQELTEVKTGVEKVVPSEVTEKEVGSTVGIREALRSVFAWSNYTTYVVTAWAFSAFAVLPSFFNLYVRSLGWDFVTLGMVLTIISLVGAGSRLVGGYVGDTVDRKKLAVAAMGMVATYHIILGLFVDFSLIFIGLLIVTTNEVFRGGSSAYIMDNIPKEHGGLALSLFTVGRSLGVLVLVAMSLLIPFVGFEQTLRVLYLFAGGLLIVCTFGRNRYLTSSKYVSNKRSVPIWKQFWQDNKRAGRLLLSVMPGVLVVVTFDAISDSLFKFGALIYANEYLGVSYSGIIIIQLISLLIVGPLLLKIGRWTDKRGTRRTALAVYSIMPICAGVFIIAPQFPLWAPESVYLSAEAMMAGLGAVFTTPFVGIVLKTVNDALWGLMVLTLVHKSLPREDTSKVLAIFWFLVYVCASLAPIIAGFVFEYAGAENLFYIVLVINLMILVAIARLGTKANPVPV